MTTAKTSVNTLLDLFVFSLLTFTAGFSSAQIIPVGRMPVIQAETLSERKVVLPQDLPGEKTLALIAFGRDQQPSIDTWVQALQLTTSNEPWVELPVIEMSNSWVRSFIDSGMRRGVRDEVMRDRIITLYTDRGPFLKSMGLPQITKTIYVVIVSRSGEVLASVEGDYSEAKAAVLAKAYGSKTQ